MKPVKNGFAQLFGNARSLVIDSNANGVADPGGGDFDQAAGGRETDGVVDDIVDCSCEPVGVSQNDCAVLARTGKGDAGVALFAPMLPRIYQLLDQRAEVDRFELGTRQLGIGSRGFADVADQPVQPDYV